MVSQALLAGAVALGSLSVGSAYTATATATFNNDDLYGTVTFSQDSVTGVTTIQTALTGLSYDYHYWHVHTNPMGGATVCENVGTDWNPSGFDNSVVCTPDLTDANKAAHCAVGDLSGKLGMLHRNTSSATWTDKDTPVIGKESIIGHPLVIHNPLDGSYKACADIMLSGNVVNNYAYFHASENELSGTIHFSQVAGQPDSTTYVQFDLRPFDGVASTNHAYGIQSGATPVDFGSGTCALVTGLYDPAATTSVSCSSSLSDANMKTQCAVGELSKRHANTGFPAVISYADPNLPLSGTNSITGKQVVVYATGGGSTAWDCTQVLTEQEYNDLTKPVNPPVTDDDDSAIRASGSLAALVLAIAAAVRLW